MLRTQRRGGTEIIHPGGAPGQLPANGAVLTRTSDPVRTGAALAVTHRLAKRKESEMSFVSYAIGLGLVGKPAARAPGQWRPRRSSERPARAVRGGSRTWTGCSGPNPAVPTLFHGARPGGALQGPGPVLGARARHPGGRAGRPGRDTEPTRPTAGRDVVSGWAPPVFLWGFSLPGLHLVGMDEVLRGTVRLVRGDPHLDPSLVVSSVFPNPRVGNGALCP